MVYHEATGVCNFNLYVAMFTCTFVEQNKKIWRQLTSMLLLGLAIKEHPKYNSILVTAYYVKVLNVLKQVVDAYCIFLHFMIFILKSI